MLRLAPLLRSALHLRHAPLLRYAPLALGLAVALPVAAGLVAAAAPVFDPKAGDAAARLLAEPGVLAASLLSLGVGLASTALALGAAFLFLAGLAAGGRLQRRLLSAVSPLLATPHAAAAFGLAFLAAPSGWLARLLSPWATGWDRPPDLLLIQDPYGVALTLGLVAKEIPFLLLLALAALPQIDAPRRLRVARSLGRGPLVAWATTVAPALYPLLRLPTYAVIAYSCSTVDVALILGPTTPAPLAVLVLRWMYDPDLAMRGLAAAGALAQLALAAAAIGLWRLGERAAWAATRAAAEGGVRSAADRLLMGVGFGVVAAASLAVFAGLLGLLVSSFGHAWRFPDALPESFTLRHWTRAADGLAPAFGATLAVGALSAVAALALVTAALEAESRAGGAPPRWRLAALYAPLLAPQVSFLFGLSVVADAVGASPGLGLVAAAHFLFVAPYVYLSLAEAYRRFDPRYLRAARALGLSPWEAFWRVRAPMLLGPAAVALAVGFAVSVSQYLPTLLLGAGRVATVTTEAVALSSGGDRRLIGVWAIAQAATPAAGFWLATLLPALLWRSRRGMRGDGRDEA